MASVTIDNADVIPESPGLAATRLLASDETCIWLLGNYFFRRGRGNVTIVLHRRLCQRCPGDLAQACIELVAFKYKLRDKTGLGHGRRWRSRRPATARKTCLPASKTVLDSYRRLLLT